MAIMRYRIWKCFKLLGLWIMVSALLIYAATTLFIVFGLAQLSEKGDITIPSPIATVNFDVYSVGTYIVEVD